MNSRRLWMILLTRVLHSGDYFYKTLTNIITLVTKDYIMFRGEQLSIKFLQANYKSCSIVIKRHIDNLPLSMPQWMQWRWYTEMGINCHNNSQWIAPVWVTCLSISVTSTVWYFYWRHFYCRVRVLYVLVPVPLTLCIIYTHRLRLFVRLYFTSVRETGTNPL